MAALVFSLGTWLIVRRVSRPLIRLTHATEKLGRGEDLEPVPEEGPDDIRSTIATFNRMQVRLRRYVEDRTHMLAAISHDLRTPITTLRLRAEFVTDPDAREKILATLAEWERSLQFGRLRIDLTELYAAAVAQGEQLGADIIEQAQNIAGVTIAALGSLLLIIVLSLYMLMDSRRILGRLRGAVPRRYTDEVKLLERSVSRAFGGFLRAQLILAVLQAALVELARQKPGNNEALSSVRGLPRHHQAARTGEPLWRHRLGGVFFASPVGA